ncbi:hypothetical protein PV762_08520 [Mitsuaria sp. CC2]|uniref:hypothetical protein n=1 Tax=Mitsuaria sp. CC2 TaxID=3029186 RepID=UPI003B8AD8CB
MKRLLHVGGPSELVESEGRGVIDVPGIQAAELAAFHGLGRERQHLVAKIPQLRVVEAIAPRPALKGPLDRVQAPRDIELPIELAPLACRLGQVQSPMEVVQEC